MTTRNTSQLFSRLATQLTRTVPCEVLIARRRNLGGKCPILTSLKPLLKSVLQRARYCLVVDSTCRSDLQIDNLMPDVMMMTMPLARIPEMAEMVVAIFAPELTGFLKEPPPQRMIIANVLDHMACEGLLIELNAVMDDTRNPDGAGGLPQLVPDALETAVGILRGRLEASVLFVSPPGFMNWERILQKFVYLLMEVCNARLIDFALSVPRSCEWVLVTCALLDFLTTPT